MDPSQGLQIDPQYVAALQGQFNSSTVDWGQLASAWEGVQQQQQQQPHQQQEQQYEQQHFQRQQSYAGSEDETEDGGGRGGRGRASSAFGRDGPWTPEVMRVRVCVCACPRVSVSVRTQAGVGHCMRTHARTHACTAPLPPPHTRVHAWLLQPHASHTPTSCTHAGGRQAAGPGAQARRQELVRLLQALPRPQRQELQAEVRGVCGMCVVRWASMAGLAMGRRSFGWLGCGWTLGSVAMLGSVRVWMWGAATTTGPCLRGACALAHGGLASPNLHARQARQVLLATGYGLHYPQQ